MTASFLSRSPHARADRRSALPIADRDRCAALSCRAPASRSQPRLPAGSPGAFVSVVVSCECGGVCSCMGEYRSESRARPKCTDSNVGHRQNCRSIISVRSPSSYGRSRPQRFSPASPSATCAPPNDGSPVNSSLPASSLPPSSSRSQGENKPRRHSWSDPIRFFNNPDRPDIGKSERTCRNGCGIVKVTVHPGGSQRAWQEFYRNGERIEGKRTPECEGMI